MDKCKLSGFCFVLGIEAMALGRLHGCCPTELHPQACSTLTPGTCCLQRLEGSVNLLQLDLQMVVNYQAVLGAKPGSSVRTSALH